MQKPLVTALLLSAVFFGIHNWASTPVAHGGSTTIATENGDTNGDRRIDLSDAIGLLNYLFSNGPEPVPVVDPESDARISALEAEMAAMEAELAAVEADVLSCQSAKVSLQESLDDSQVELENLQTANADLQSILNNSQTDLQSCQTDLVTSQTERTDLQATLQTCQTDLQAAQTDLQTCHDDLATSSADFLTCQNDNATLEVSLQNARDDLMVCEAEGASRGLPDTGQTLCYDAAGTVVDCATGACPGQDGSYETGCSSVDRFVDNQDGTVTDTCTGLMWQKDSADIDSDSQIDGADVLAWCDAATFCGDLSFGTFEDWRLPSVRELQSLADYGQSNPSIDPVFTSFQWKYWSSSSVGAFPGAAWIVLFTHGVVDGAGTNELNHVRAVRDAR